MFVNKTLLCTGLAMCASLSMAQTFRTSQRGEFIEDGRRQIMENARLDVNRGRFVLTFSTQRDQRIRVDGSISGSGTRRNLQVTSVNGNDRASGSGTASVYLDSLRSVDLSYRSGGDSAVIRFGSPVPENWDGTNRPNSDRPGWDGRPGWPDRPTGGTRPDWDENRRETAGGETSGKGYMRIGRDERDFRKVEFKLREDGTITIRVTGGEVRDRTFQGRWSGRGLVRNFRLNTSDRWDQITGEGTLRLSDDRKEIRSLSMDGRLGGDRLSVDFRDR